MNSHPERGEGGQSAKPWRYALMEQKPYALDGLDFEFRWGPYGFRVLRCHLTYFPPGKSVALHKHSEYEFHFIPRGKGTVIIEGTTYALQEGMFYLTAPGVLHYQEADRDVTMDELCLHLDIVPLQTTEDRSWGAEHEEAEAEYFVDSLRRLPFTPVQDRFGAMEWFLTAYRAWHEKDAAFFTVFRHAVIQIISRAVRAHFGRPSEEAPNFYSQVNVQRQRYLLSTQFIEDNYATPITLEDVAEKIGISGRQLQRIFREEGQTTFGDYLASVRYAHVCNELLNSSLTIEEIALRNGFVNSHYLYFAFKKRFGMTPSQYRKQQRIREAH